MIRKQKKVMIATLYSHDPVIAGAMKTGVDELYLVVDYKPDKTQEEAIKKVKGLLGGYVNIKTINTDVYDLVKVTEDCIKIIDKIPNSVLIYLNVSAARKTKSMSLMFAGYSRNHRIHQIMYVTKEKKEVIILPKLSFNLSNSEKKVLVSIGGNHELNLREIIYKTKLSRAQFYKSLRELQKKGMVGDNYHLTDAGKIAIL